MIDTHSGMKVLIVEDMLAFRKFLKAQLSALGLRQVTETEDGALAWKALEEAAKANEPFDLIICDWNMPHMNGLELLKAVRGDSRFRHLPFLMLTAEAEVSSIMTAFEAGVSDYVVKPFNSDQLQKKLGLVLSNREPPGGEAVSQPYRQPKLPEPNH